MVWQHTSWFNPCCEGESSICIWILGRACNWKAEVEWAVDFQTFDTFAWLETLIIFEKNCARMTWDPLEVTLTFSLFPLNIEWRPNVASYVFVLVRLKLRKLRTSNLTTPVSLTLPIAAVAWYCFWFIGIATINFKLPEGKIVSCHCQINHVLKFKFKWMKCRFPLWD